MIVIQDVFGRIDLMSKEEMAEALELLDIASKLSSNARDVLRQLRDHGPTESGGLISKAGRDILVGCGAAEKIVVQGKQGFQACTYRGWALCKVVDALYPPKSAAKDAANPVDLDAATNRFLGWRLPEDFRPDGGISLNEWYQGATGTNLLSYTQAKEMLGYALGDGTASGTSP